VAVAYTGAEDLLRHPGRSQHDRVRRCLSDGLVRVSLHYVAVSDWSEPEWVCDIGAACSH
jgi:hypothetical protein